MSVEAPPRPQTSEKNLYAPAPPEEHKAYRKRIKGIFHDNRDFIQKLGDGSELIFFDFGNRHATLVKSTNSDSGENTYSLEIEAERIRIWNFTEKGPISKTTISLNDNLNQKPESVIRTGIKPLNGELERISLHLVNLLFSRPVLTSTKVDNHVMPSFAA